MIPSDKWQAEAACRDQPVEWFYPGAGQTTHRAKAICEECPVVSECLNYVLLFEEPRERFGVWAGMSANERIKMFDRIPEKVCAEGHELTQGNVVIIDGDRQCRSCQARQRTHCGKNHELVGDNLIAHSSGIKQCRECARQRSRESRERVLARKVAAA